jgi:Ca2+-binding RTX toxin-like protein
MAVFYVSTTGSDTATGLSLTDAFKTVDKAVAAMHASGGADTIMIRGGTYEIKSSLVFTDADNGSSIQAYGNEKPVLLGGQAVTGWTAGANGIWTAPLAQADLHQLTLNGERMTEARFPNAVASDPVKGGWLWANAAALGIDTKTQMAFDTADISTSQLQAGMKVHLFTDASWAEVDLTVQSVDWSKGVVTFAEAAPYDIGAASRFYVHDAKVHLDQPGEWWFDTAKQVINFKAPPNFNGTGVVASGDHSIIHIDNAANISISGLSFSDVGTGAATSDVETAAIKITAGSFIKITGNTFSNVVKGVESTYFSDHITVANNDFSHIWSSAIQLGHQSSQNTVTGNSIWRAGEVFATFAAIDMAENWGNLILENLIRDVPRIGIGELNYDSALKSGGNTIENNIIVHSSQTTSDSGAIYIYSKPDNTHLGDAIRNNIIVDTGGLETANGAFLPRQLYTNGIYLDDNTSRAQVYNNFVQGSVVGGAYIHGGSGNSIFNNVLLDNKNVGVQLFDIGKPMTGNDVRGNIIEVPFGTGFVVQNNNGNPAAPASVHDNFILNSAGRPISFELAYTTKTLAQWQALGFDVGTDVINSGIFVSPSTGDYSLKAGALPLQQGFTPLPLASMQAFRDGIFKWGTTGNDSLTGGKGGDLLEGLAGNDMLSGGVGKDMLVGDDGNDTLIGGTEIDTMQGQAGDDVLEGGKGADIMSGGFGADTFLYRAIVERLDVISDFTSEDSFAFLASAFGNLAKGTLAASAFQSSTAALALTPDVRFYYETDKDVLRYDPDGSGAQLPLYLAHLSNHAVVSVDDIVLF